MIELYSVKDVSKIFGQSESRLRYWIQSGFLWPSVRRGEERNIFPYQGNADYIFNSALPYETSILKQYALPVLQAAHIKPYARSGPNRTSNGLLLRADLHLLFDEGYLTVTPEHRVEVSRRIREEFENGRDYYALHGQPLKTLPALPEDLRFQLSLGPVRPRGDSDFMTAHLRTNPGSLDLQRFLEPGAAPYPVIETQARMGTSEYGPFTVDELVPPRSNPWHSHLRLSALDFLATNHDRVWDFCELGIADFFAYGLVGVVNNNTQTKPPRPCGHVCIPSPHRSAVTQPRST